MRTTLVFSAFNQEAWHDRKIPLEGEAVRAFAAQNHFTYSEESPYDHTKLGIVATSFNLVKQHVIEGNLHALPFQFFQRFGVKSNSGSPSTYSCTTMAVITLPAICPEVVITSVLATRTLTDSGIERDDNYAGQRITTGDSFIDTCIAMYAPVIDHGEVRQFLHTSNLAEIMVRYAPFCNLRISGNSCIVYIDNKEYFAPSYTSPAALYLYGLQAIEAIAGALSQGFQTVSFAIDNSEPHRLHISRRRDWQMMGWVLAGAAVLVAIISYLIIHQATALVWLSFGGVLTAIFVAYFILSTRSGVAKEAQLLQQLRARYTDICLLP